MHKRPYGPNTSNLRSVYQFANYIWSKADVRTVKFLNFRDETADLIRTAILNRSTGTSSIYGVPFDIDADKTHARFLDSDGRVVWQNIEVVLAEEFPWLLSAITYAVESYSGKGLGLLICIPPTEKIDSNSHVLALGCTVQRRIIEILRGMGIGADRCAVGLDRLMPNWLNLEKRVYGNDIARARIEKERPAVLNELIDEINRFAQATYIKKSDRSDVLYPHLRVEKKLAGLYLKLFDDYYQAKGETEVIQIDSDTLHDWIQVSRAIYTKILTKGLEWLKLKPNEEGYELTFRPSGTLTERAIAIESGRVTDDRKYSHVVGRLDMSRSVVEPEQVVDGERNAYITRIAVELKHYGVEESEAINVLRNIAEQVPCDTTSWSISHYSTICRAIYRNQPELCGCRAGMRLPQVIALSMSNSGTETFQKGEPRVWAGVLDAAMGDDGAGKGEVGLPPPSGWVGAPKIDDQALQVANTRDCASTQELTTREFQRALLSANVSAETKITLLESIVGLAGAARQQEMQRILATLKGECA